MSSKSNNFLINLLTAFLAITIFGGTLELGSRVFMKSKHTLNEYKVFIESQGVTPKNKTAGEKRIMIVGESAARGVPYTMDASVSGLLQTLLNESGNRNLKIINTGVPGRHSFYQLEEGRDLVRYGADAVILYAGNNDARDFSNVMRDMPLAYLDFKLTWNSFFYRSLKHKLLKLKKWMNKKAGKNIFTINYNQDDVWHWTDDYLKKKKKYLDDPELGMKRKIQAVQDYERNLDQLTGYLKRHYITVFVCNLPIVHEAMPQIGDWSRKGYQFDQKVVFKNVKEQAAWRRHFDQGRAALEKNDHAKAIQHFEEAEKINDSYPMLFYYLGKSYAGMQNYAQAKLMYVKSKDVQIQSPGGDSFKSEALKKIAAKHKVTFVDLQAALEEVAPHGLVGMELFLDHCHPNSLGHKILAAQMMQSLCDTGYAQCPSNISRKYWLEKLMGELNNQNLAREYLLVAFYHFKGTLWNNQPDYKQAIEYLEKARAIMPENVNIYPLLAASYWNAGNKEKAAQNLDQLKKLDQNEYKKTLVDFPYLAQLAA